MHDAASVQEQTPLEHLNPGGHVRPQAPQLCGSEARFRQPAGDRQHVSKGSHASAPLQEQTSLFVCVSSLQCSPRRQWVLPHLHKPLFPPDVVQVPLPLTGLQSELESQLHWFAGRPAPPHENPPACAVQSLPQLPQCW